MEMMKLVPCVLTLVFWSGVAMADAKKPNVVVILCDDLGWGDLACYGNGTIRTPNLDRMAAEGVRFTSMYSAAPVCSPSRVGLLTGRNPNLAGVYDWIPEAQAGAKNSRDLVHMRESETTVPMILKKAGYATAMAGKWHCNAVFNDPAQPQPGDAGFDHWFATQNNAEPSHEDPVNFVRNGKPAGKIEGFSCQIVADEGISWMKGHTGEYPEQPFFLFLTFHEPHEPVASPEKLVAQYRDKAENEDQAQYFANVANVDAAVGRVLAALDEAGQRENTLVIFTSDNGPETANRYPKANRSYGTPGSLKGMKLWTHEAGFRVPGIMNWPGKIKAGQVSDVPVSSLDFLPTFAKLAGTEPPEDLAIDGTDVSGFLEGGELVRKRPLFWTYYNAINGHRAAMRDGDWKIMAKLNGGQLPKFGNIDTMNGQQVKDAVLTDFLLFNLAEDASEENDLSAKDPARLSDMSRELEKRYRGMVGGMHVWPVK